MSVACGVETGMRYSSQPGAGFRAQQRWVFDPGYVSVHRQQFSRALNGVVSKSPSPNSQSWLLTLSCSQERLALAPASFGWAKVCRRGLHQDCTYGHI